MINYTTVFYGIQFLFIKIDFLIDKTEFYVYNYYHKIIINRLIAKIYNNLFGAFIMARKILEKKIRSKPVAFSFVPASGMKRCSAISIDIEEWEAVRLVDYLGIERIEAAKSMGISRQTLNILLKAARTKTARAVVEGLSFSIIDGNNADYAPKDYSYGERRKEMKIAVTHENGNVFGHFGKSKEFAIFEAEDGKVVSSHVEKAPEEGHGAMVGFLTGLGVDILICGGIGAGAVNALKEAGISIYAGASGNVEMQVSALLNGQLSENSEANCGHKSEAGHNCGHHN